MGCVEKERVVIDLSIGTVGLHLCVRSGHCHENTYFKELS